MFTVAILAGGLATRLRPITTTIPKALVEVAGRPFIFRQLEFLRNQGVRRVVLCVGYLGWMIEDVVGSGESFGLQVLYSSDGPNLLGTGGALKKALPMLGNDFFVLYGDSFLPVDFFSVERAFLISGTRALMTVLANDNRWDKSNVLFSNGRLIEYNKRAPSSNMGHIDYGLAVLSMNVLAHYKDNQAFDLADLYESMSKQGELAGFEVFERFYEIGSHSGLKQTEEYFLTKEKL